MVHTNPETQHSNAVLNEKDRDEYLLNPCETSGGRFFYVELCESILPSRVDIANFELFSSGPKDFTVVGSDKYPSPEWILLGNWTAKETREIQVNLPKNSRGATVPLPPPPVTSLYRRKASTSN